jgi:exonuclease VII small subunit
VGVVGDLAKNGAKKAIGYIDRFSKADPQVISLVNDRLTEQDKWNDVFSTKLIELLDKNDVIRSEIRKRLDQIAAASRAQQELIRVAEEHRTLNTEYQKTASVLAAAQEKFARAEKILVDAAELKQRSTAYESAERQLGEARQALQKSATALEEARTIFQQAQQATTELLKKAESFATRVESGGKEAESKFALAHQKFDAGNSALGRASDVATEAAAMYNKASQAAQAASAAHATTISKLGNAQSALDGATKQFTEATRVQAKAADDLNRAEGLVRTSEQRLNQATVEKHAAETILTKAEKRVRQAASYALVALLAAVSICIWGVVRGVAASEYGAIAPAVMTVAAVAFGVYVWSKSG